MPIARIGWKHLPVKGFYSVSGEGAQTDKTRWAVILTFLAILLKQVSDSAPTRLTPCKSISETEWISQPFFSPSVFRYNFIWNSPLICPVSGPSSSSDGDGAGGLSGGWIFIIVYVSDPFSSRSLFSSLLFSLLFSSSSHFPDPFLLSLSFSLSLSLSLSLFYIITCYERLICATFLYLVGGVLWNKYRLEKSGLELIPNIDFWLALPGLVKDGCFYSWEKANALREKFSSRYETV